MRRHEMLFEYVGAAVVKHMKLCYPTMREELSNPRRLREQWNFTEIGLGHFHVVWERWEDGCAEYSRNKESKEREVWEVLKLECLASNSSGYNEEDKENIDPLVCWSCGGKAYEVMLSDDEGGVTKGWRSTK